MISLLVLAIALQFDLLPLTTGLSTVKLQEDGIFSNQAFLRLKGGLPRNLIDFTLCARLNLNYLRGRENYWFSLGNSSHDSLLTGAFVQDANGSRLSIQRYHPTILDEITLKFPDGFDFQRWNHFCFVFQSYAQVPYPGGDTNLTIQAYHNGAFIREVTRVVPKSSFVEIDKGATLVLGQKQDNSKQSFDSEASFSGRIGDISLWRGQLVNEEIKALAACKTVSAKGIILSWDLDEYEFDAQLVEVDNQGPCREDPTYGRALFNYGAPREAFKFLCDKLNGMLPVFKDLEDRNQKYGEIKGLFSASFNNLTCEAEGEIYFWTGIEEDITQPENVFINGYTSEPLNWDLNLFPGPASTEIKCTMVRGKNFIAKEKCESELPCGICDFDPQKILTLKGLCIRDLKPNGDFDTEYYVHGMIDQRPHFRGHRASHIFYNATDQTWILASLKNPKKKSILKAQTAPFQFPLGRIPWTVQTESNEIDARGICHLGHGEQHFLAFSDCHPQGFTCTNGACIQLDQKCDSILDCSDGSDEDDCEFLLIDESYAKDKPPLRDDKKPLDVFFSIDIGAFPEIDSTNFKIKSDYELQLRWYDSRLRYRDLNDETRFNDVSSKSRTHLWSPRLEFVNTLGPVKYELDDETALRLVKEEDETLPEDFSMPREARLYSGEGNSLMLQRRYSQDHTCQFDLYYYPFDNQVCPLIFELRDRTEQLIHFEKDVEPITYRGARSLSQYEIAGEDLEISRNAKNFSTAVVRVILRHRTEFHVVNSFIQTLIVLMVAFATFFFDLEDFSDRIMVNSVLLLVMATINASIQAHVPSTSYFKLIDVWLLFCVIMIVIVILLHTVLAAFFTGGDPDQPGRTHVARSVSPWGRVANWGAMILFVVIILIFNIVFWVIALKEFNMEAAQILAEKRPIK